MCVISFFRDRMNIIHSSPDYEIRVAIIIKVGKHRTAQISNMSINFEVTNAAGATESIRIEYESLRPPSAAGGGIKAAPRIGTARTLTCRDVDAKQQRPKD